MWIVIRQSGGQGLKQLGCDIPTPRANRRLTKDKKLMKQQEVLGGYNATDYVTERLYATAKDGTKVPISLVYKKGFKKDGNAPLLLYAYGS